MPQTIPYDPAFALANLVEDDTIKLLSAIAEAQAPIDIAEEDFTAALLAFRSLNMTRSELQSMGVDDSQLKKPIEDASKAITEKAGKLAEARIEGLTNISEKKQALRDKLSGIEEYPESPVDYNKTQIKKMPLSADSMKMDAQYFSFDENVQSANSHAATIKAYVANTTSFLGDSYSAEASASAQTQVSAQLEHHELQGTLVITAACTHKEAAVLAPLILDVDKAIRVWNDIFDDDNDKIKTNSLKSMQKIAEDQQTSKAKKIHILSGATYGSSFIGMVHVLKADDTASSQSMESVAATLQGQMSVGSWFASEEGGFGVNSTFSDSAKNLLSTQNVSSHVSIISMGSIPIIQSHSVDIGVKQFANFDPAAMTEKLAVLQNATASDQDSVANAAQAARTGGKMMAIRSTEIKSVMDSLGKIDDGQNQMLDINSLMIAFTDYVQKAIAGNVGVPINYYLKSITASQLAQMWVQKYYPNRYITAAGDDSGDTSTSGAQSGGTDTGADTQGDTAATG